MKKEAILNLLNSPIKIDILEKTESTNDYLKNDHDHNPRVCIAEMQTKGRGQLDKSWHSPAGKNIYLSLRYPIKKSLRELSGLSLVIGLATSKAIEHPLKTQHPFLVKWPNDIMYDHHKVAGILIESKSITPNLAELIIGIGINVNMQEANEANINQPWSSLQIITGQYLDRNPLCAALINCLVDYLERFAEFGLTDFMDEWKQKDYLFGKPYSTGLGAGINEQGNLLLRTADNTIKAYSSSAAIMY
jgi:BirA family biotin operon repressor/biotin-[acetyl-CoA-carboxylase] ligase